MKFLKTTILLTSLLCFRLISFSCDRTSINVTNIVYDGTYYTYTADVCIGISPNWGETNSFCIETVGSTITGSGPYTSSFTSNYNYCTETLSFNGQGCATTAMGAAPAGGTVQTANVSVSGNVSGGNLCFSGGGGDAIAPDDLVGDCADCNNPSQLCWSVQFSTTSPITSVQLTGAEGGAATCPDEIDTSLPPTPPSCTPPSVSATIDGGSSVTVCEGQEVTIVGTCTTNCDTDDGNNSVTGTDGFVSSYMGGGSNSTFDETGGVVTVTSTATATTSGTYTFQNGTGSCFATSTVDIIVIPAPTAALNVAEVNDCSTADVEVTFTGTGPWTFSYDDGTGSTSVTTSSNPYTISGLSNSTTVSLDAGVTSGACGPSLVGTTSGTTDVNITTVSSAAGDDWQVKINTDEPLDGTGTAGLVGYDTTITPSIQTSAGCSGDCQFDDDGTGTDWATSNGISLNSLGIDCVGGTIGIDNIPDESICVSYSGSKAGDIEAELCFGGTCVTVPAGSVGDSPYCFDRGTVFNLLSGASCSSTSNITVALVDTRQRGPVRHGTLTGISVTLNDVDLTVRDNPTYTWTAASGDANVADLSCTDCEDPIFNSSIEGSGCFDLTVTDGFGCTSTDQVCYVTVLSESFNSLDVSITDNETALLNWEVSNKNFSEYVIERSIDGKKFVEIGKSPSNEGVLEHYFEDINPSEVAYYRVKAIKESGDFETSNTKFVSFNITKNIEIQKIYPNPTSSKINVELLTKEDSEVIYKLVNTTGQIVKETSFSTKKGNFTHSMDISKHPKGIYQLIVIEGNTKITSRIDIN